MPDGEFNPYSADKKWDWRDKEASWIEELILDWYGAPADQWIPVFLLGAVAFAFAWGLLEFILLFVFNQQSSVGFTWEVSMDTGLIILFALCGTVLGSVGMWCVTVYKLRMAQLAERKEIRQAEVDKEMWKRLPMESMQKAISNR